MSRNARAPGGPLSRNAQAPGGPLSRNAQAPGGTLSRNARAPDGSRYPVVFTQTSNQSASPTLWFSLDWNVQWSERSDANTPRLARSGLKQSGYRFDGIRLTVILNSQFSILNSPYPKFAKRWLRASIASVNPLCLLCVFAPMREPLFAHNGPVLLVSKGVAWTQQATMQNTNRCCFFATA